MRYDSIDYRCGFNWILFALLISFAQSTRNKTIFLAGYSHFDVLAKLTLDSFHFTIAHSNPLRVALDRLQRLLGLLVAFKQLDSPITGREVLGQLITHRTHNRLQCLDTALDNCTVVNVDMAHTTIAVLVDINHRVEQSLQTLPVTCHDGHHRYTQHCAQLLIVELVATLFQLIEHI